MCGIPRPMKTSPDGRYPLTGGIIPCLMLSILLMLSQRICILGWMDRKGSPFDFSMKNLIPFNVDSQGDGGLTERPKLSRVNKQKHKITFMVLAL